MSLFRVTGAQRVVKLLARLERDREELQAALTEIADEDTALAERARAIAQQRNTLSAHAGTARRLHEHYTKIIGG